MKLGTTLHPKFRRLAKQLSLPQYAVVGILEMLWMLAAQFAPDDGDVTRFSADEIADYCDYDGDADSLLEALVATRWIDRDADSLTIHGWLEHRPGYLNDRARKREERARIPREFENVRIKSATVPDNPGKSDLGKPSLGMPGHAMPSPTLSAAARAAAEENFRLMDPAEMTRLANRLLKASGGKLPQDFIWTATFVCEALSAGMVSELCTRLSEGSVRKPRSYIESALRAEGERLGMDWRELVPLVPAPVMKS